MTRVLIGIVGYFQFIRGYPLGPEFMQRLQSVAWPEGVSIKEMNWGPIAIVQDFQASTEKYDRIILVGSVDRGLEPGMVSCHYWTGGEPDPLAVQRRVFEAVTGVISLDNLLIIGAHFGVWPEELITVEVQFAEDGLSELVLEEIASVRAMGDSAVIGEKPLNAENDLIVRNLVLLTRRAVLGGKSGVPEIKPLTADRLTSVAAVCHHRFVENDHDVRHSNGTGPLQ